MDAAHRRNCCSSQACGLVLYDRKIQTGPLAGSLIALAECQAPSYAQLVECVSQIVTRLKLGRVGCGLRLLLAARQFHTPGKSGERL